MSAPGLAARRLSATKLPGPPLASPVEVVRWFGAVQSQDHGPSCWSLGQRLAPGSRAQVERDFDDGRFVRTHVLRPTWHHVAPEDLRELQALTSARVHAINGTMYRKLELEASTFGRAAELLVAALEGGRHLTRPEAAEVLAAGGVVASGFRLGYLLMHAELSSLVCSGPLRGRHHTYALVDERVPPAAERSREEALADLVVRYFRSHGPATARDLRWWASLTAVDVRAGLALAGDALDSEVVDGVTYWSAPAPVVLEPSPTAHLVHGYDEYVVAFSESSALADASGLARAATRNGVVANGVVLVDGQVLGAWRGRTTAGAVAVEAVAYRALGPSEVDALHAAAARLGTFLGLAASLTVLTHG